MNRLRPVEGNAPATQVDPLALLLRDLFIAEGIGKVGTAGDRDSIFRNCP